METPVPIPNTMVKHMSADDTWLETARESRWLPDYIKIVSETDKEEEFSSDRVKLARPRRSYLPIFLIKQVNRIV